MELRKALADLADAAERFVNKAPNQTRLETERAALLDALRRAQLLLSLSLKDRPSGSRQGKPSRGKPSRRPTLRLAK
ncbi:MAG: hypothetical protein ACREIM_06175 [Nitrospiraceae bacterium]